MEDKEVKCSCKIIYRRIILICGILAGLMLAVLGIVTITADTYHLFTSGKFFQWYTTDIRKITFTDDKTFSSTGLWARPHELLYFEWTTHGKMLIMETDEKFKRLETGLRSAYTSTGKEYFHLDNITFATHYFCQSDDGVWCMHYSDGSVRKDRTLTVYMYKGTPFYTNGFAGNQNFRWTFFILACLAVTFGVIMILGELHVPLITTKFTFFYYSFVKGLIYFAIGFLVMGMSNIFGLFTAIVLWLVGILNCIYGYRSLLSFQWTKIGARGTTTIVTRREYI